MKKKIKHISKGKSAGQKTDSRAESSRLYVIYDTCDKCPLWAYISLVCDDDLSALVISGNPPREVLEDAKINIIHEFAEASGSAGMTLVASVRKEYYLSRTHILGLGISVQAIRSGDHEAAFEYLRKHGIMPSDDTNAIEKLIGQVENKISLKKVSMERAIKRMESSIGNNKPPARDDFEDQLVIISKHVGFNLDSSITLRRYAGYIKMLKKSMKNEQSNTK